MFALTCFFFARANKLQKFPFRNCIVGLVVVGADACSSANQLANDSIRERSHWNLLREVNYRFAKARCAFLQIVNRFGIRLFSHTQRVVVAPVEIIVGIFGLRHSFVIRHRALVIYANMSVTQRA